MVSFLAIVRRKTGRSGGSRPTNSPASAADKSSWIEILEDGWTSSDQPSIDRSPSPRATGVRFTTRRSVARPIAIILWAALPTLLLLALTGCGSSLPLPTLGLEASASIQRSSTSITEATTCRSSKPCQSESGMDKPRTGRHSSLGISSNIPDRVFGFPDAGGDPHPSY